MIFKTSRAQIQREFYDKLNETLNLIPPDSDSVTDSKMIELITTHLKTLKPEITNRKVCFPLADGESCVFMELGGKYRIWVFGDKGNNKPWFSSNNNNNQSYSRSKYYASSFDANEHSRLIFFLENYVDFLSVPEDDETAQKEKLERLNEKLAALKAQNEERIKKMDGFALSLRVFADYIPRNEKIASEDDFIKAAKKEFKGVLSYSREFQTPCFRSNDGSVKMEILQEFVHIKAERLYFHSIHYRNRHEFKYEFQDFPRAAYFVQKYLAMKETFDNEGFEAFDAEYEKLKSGAESVKLEMEKKIKLQEIASAAIKALLVSEQKKRSFTYRMEKSTLITNVTLSGKDSWNFNLELNAYSNDIDLQEVMNRLKTVIQIAPLKKKGV